MKRVLRQTVVIFSMLLATGFLSAESFRVRKVVPVELSGDSLEEKSVSIGINDAISVNLPEDMTYVEGIELKIQIPSAVADWRDSVAMSIYDGLTPAPSSSQIDYAGTRIFVTPLPSRLTWIVQVPLTEKNSIKDSNYISKIGVIPETKGGKVFFRFQPAMKGVPDSTYEAQLAVAVKPVLINKGALKVSVKAPDNDAPAYEILVDDEPVKFIKGKVLLSKGNHNINLQAEEYRSEVRTVYIEQAKTTSIDFVLKSLAPTVTVTAPSNAAVYFDGVKFDQLGKEVVVSEGQHNVRCVVGGYEVVRALDVHKGKSYSVNLTIDLEVSEE